MRVRTACGSGRVFNADDPPATAGGSDLNCHLKAATRRRLSRVLIALLYMKFVRGEPFEGGDFQMKKQKKIESKQGASATGFESNPFYERLLEMKQHKPDTFKTLSVVTRIALEAYIKAKTFSTSEVSRIAA